MSPIIIDRGRGPEIAGTRITVYRIMDYVPDAVPPDEVAQELGLSIEQVQAALDYIAAHRHEVEAEYAKIIERIQRGEPQWVKDFLATAPSKVREHSLAHQAAAAANNGASE
jgi:uncharacterized protein (DUF433 family)